MHTKLLHSVILEMHKKACLDNKTKMLTQLKKRSKAHAAALHKHTLKNINVKAYCIPCPQKGGKFYPILLHKFITHRTGKIYLLFPDGLYEKFSLQYAFI